jgi:predicted AAA+ superfamily ATPase
MYNDITNNNYTVDLMFKRLFHLPLNKHDSLFIFGPRGTGKTSWLKNHLDSQDYIYIDLLDPLTFRTLHARPEVLREQIPPNYQGWIVIDEVQKIPILLDEVHRLIEAYQYQFILTGSSARKLKRSGVNLLAGRAIRYTMHTLTIQELEANFNLEHALKFGLLPAVYTYDDPAGYLATYIDVYLREEVMQEGLTRNVSAFSRFLEVASFSQGQIINASSIAREVGVDRQVIQNYLSILHDLLLSYTLPAFTKRAKRRLITSEKFYYFDAGVYQQLRPKGLLDSSNEIAGTGLETLFYQSALALIAYGRLDYQVYYWRTTSGVEVDFILYGQNALLAFEIKHSATIHSTTLTGLKHFKEDYPMATCYVLYLGSKTLYLADGIIALPFVEGLKKLPELLI